MNPRFPGPDPDDEETRSNDDEIDLRYRAYEVDDDPEEGDYYEESPRRVTDGWASETKSETPWWVKAGIAIVSILIVLGLIASMAPPFLGTSSSDESQRIEYTPAIVTDVIDMRTIIVEIDGEPATVRYIGVEPLPIDSPWYDVGFLANQQLVANQEVFLEADERDSDDFGRLLRYVYANQNMVNGLLVRNGIALPSDPQGGLDRYHFNLQGWSEAAQFERLGHWGDQPPPINRNEGFN